MTRIKIIAACLLLMGVASLWPKTAQAQVRRCTGPGGTLIFTDRRCEDIDALERAPPTLTQSTAGMGTGYRGGCMRSLQNLIQEMTSAIDTHDVNRLASLYHWTGMSTRAAYALMTRLDLIAQRPLVDVVPLQPERTVVIGDENGWRSSYSAGNYAPASAYRTPVAVRIEQTLSNGSTPSRTVFGLKQYLGCWWIKL